MHLPDLDHEPEHPAPYGRYKYPLGQIPEFSVDVGWTYHAAVIETLTSQNFMPRSRDFTNLVTLMLEISADSRPTSFDVQMACMRI